MKWLDEFREIRNEWTAKDTEEAPRVLLLVLVSILVGGLMLSYCGGSPAEFPYE